MVDPALVSRARYLATQARESVSHYEHRAVGFNYRLSNICAAIGVGQMRVLGAGVERRREIFARYQHNLMGLAGVSFMPEAPYGRSSRWLSVMLVDPAVASVTAESVRLALERANIESRPVWKPMHMQPVFAGARSIGGAVAEGLFERGLCLPSGSAMSDGEVDRVSEIVSSALRAR